MSKYGQVSRNDGHSKWFLQKTVSQHDSTMDDPWMQMIYNQSFSLRPYCLWLAANHACFKALEDHQDLEVLKGVHKLHLARTKPLEDDLSQLLGASWKSEASEMASSSKATQRYLSHFAEDAKTPIHVLAHHFLQYNAVLSGGAYLGEMVSQKLCVPHGAPGVRFYAFDGVKQGKGGAEVQRYLREFDKIQLQDEERQSMLEVMKRIYDDVEGMMKECYDIDPQAGIGYGAAKDADGKPLPVPKLPEEELLELTLSELQTYTGDNDGRILLSIAGELIDVSTGRDVYGPGCGYSILAGHDVTRCLATMSLEPEHRDDVDWKPSSEDDENVLNNWREKLKAKYPVAGSLKIDPFAGTLLATQQPGLNKGATKSSDSASAPSNTASDAGQATSANSEADQKCPISGKEGVGCPMSMFMGGAAPTPKAKAAPKTEAKTGFMAGKSMIAKVNESKVEGESFIHKLCPLHWDDNTTRLLITVAAAAWVSGIFVGWNLHKHWMQLSP
jgi:heme oxygenase